MITKKSLHFPHIVASVHDYRNLTLISPGDKQITVIAQELFTKREPLKNVSICKVDMPALIYEFLERIRDRNSGRFHRFPGDAIVINFKIFQCLKDNSYPRSFLKAWCIGNPKLSPKLKSSEILSGIFLLLMLISHRVLSILLKGLKAVLLLIVKFLNFLIKLDLILLVILKSLRSLSSKNLRTKSRGKPSLSLLSILSTVARK